MDGARLASASNDRTMKLWDVASGQEIGTLKGHTGAVASVAFNRDGTRLASASEDRTVKLWDAATGQELRTIRGLASSVWSVAFSHDDSRLAAAMDDRTVVIWDARPVMPGVKTEVEAVGRLDSLFRKPLPRSEVRAAIERDTIIGEDVPQKALELVDHFPEETDPQKYHDAAWPLISHPYANVVMCQIALAQMKAACQRAPENETYNIAVGVAQYRLGKFQKERYDEALATLGGCDQNHPATLAFQAMAQHQLGQEEQSSAALARLQEVMKDAQWADNSDARSFVREAAELIEGGLAQPQL